MYTCIFITQAIHVCLVISVTVSLEKYNLCIYGTVSLKSYYLYIFR